MGHAFISARAGNAQREDLLSLPVYGHVRRGAGERRRAAELRPSPQVRDGHVNVLARQHSRVAALSIWRVANLVLLVQAQGSKRIVSY